MPHTTAGVSPCSLMMNRGLRTHLDLLKPDTSANVHSNKLIKSSIVIERDALETFQLVKKY